MSEHERHEQLLAQLEALRGELAMQRVPAELQVFHFNGAEGISERIDQDGLQVSESYGLYNPLAIRAYIAAGSSDANEAAGALAVPAESGLILPVRFVGHVKIGVDAGELGAESALLWRLKFSTPQPFFLGGL